MSKTDKNVGNLIDNAERIAVLGSPSSTIELNLDVMAEASLKKLVGSMGIFRYIQDGFDNYALGQITEVKLINVWTQDPTMRGLIRRKGRVDPITERHDTHIGKMMISAVFQQTAKGDIEPSSLATVPCTGTFVREVNDEILNGLIQEYQKEIFYLGRIYGGNVLLPLWFKHFGKDKGGIGEAYHLGIFGKTGSGKSVLAKMMILGYARHKNMSIFILDPQGEFSKEYMENEIFKRLLDEDFDKKVEVVSLHNLVISGQKLFSEILKVSNFIKSNLRVIGDDNQDRAAKQIIRILNGKIRGQRNLNYDSSKVNPWHYYKKDVFDKVWDVLKTNDSVQRQIYKSDSQRLDMVASIESADAEEVYDEWKKIANLFSYENRKNTKIIKDLIEEITSIEKKSKVIIIDLSKEKVPEDIFWNEEIQFIVIKDVLEKLTYYAENQYKQGNSLNTLVVIDEAHRLAPNERTDNFYLEEIKKLLKDGARTTRKYGLGWLFISQTLSSLYKEIIQQMRVYVFGYGLGWGTELRALEEIIGGNKQAKNLYQSFRDPQSGLGKKEYPFMILGPISPLSFSSLPLFFNAFNYPEVYFEKNNFNFSKDK